MAKQTLPSNTLIALLSSKNGIRTGGRAIEELNSALASYNKRISELSNFVNKNPTIKNKAFLTKHEKKQTTFKRDARYIIEKFASAMSFKMYPFAAIQYEGINLLIEKIESALYDIMDFGHRYAK